MNSRKVSILTLVIFLLIAGLVIAVSPKSVKVLAASGATDISQTDSSWACLPRYSEPHEFLYLYPHGKSPGTPGPDTQTTLWGVDSADFNDDGQVDAVLWRGLFQSGEAFEIDILLNDGSGTLALGTSQVFSGKAPSVVEGRELLLADFNGDDRLDMFFADQGMDNHPFPGHQNTLALSAPGGKMIDTTSNLPQQSDQTHSAAAADIDGDDDIDLYIGNLGGGGVLPQLWLNNGAGVFTIAQNLLPPEQTDLSLNWYTTSAFADVNNDTYPDLILGQGNPNRGSHVLLNDGTGHFAQMATPLPPTIFAPNQQPVDIKAADISGDGYVDLFLSDTRSSYAGRYIQILINKGNGTFRDETAARLPQSSNFSPWIVWLDLVDINMDGNLDLVVKPIGETEPFFYLNNGAGDFYPLANVFNIGTDNLFTFMDLDQNGFLDILWAYPGCYDGTCPEIHNIVRAQGCPLFLPGVYGN